MKSIVILLCFSLVLLNGCKFLTGKSAKTVDTIIADTVAEEIIDSADLYTGIGNETAGAPVEPVATPSIITSNASVGRYYMIVGCFTVPENADRFAQKVRGMGYDAQIITGISNYRMVAARSYTSFRESVSEIDKFRNEVTPNAWVYLQR